MTLILPMKSRLRSG